MCVIVADILAVEERFASLRQSGETDDKMSLHLRDLMVVFVLIINLNNSRIIPSFGTLVTFE